MNHIIFFQQFYTHQGAFRNSFEHSLPGPVSSEELKIRSKSFSISDVKKYAEESGNVEGRLAFFDTFHANSEFYQRVAKPLLSMRAVGSIDVERRIKKMKGTIITKKRNRIKDPKGVAYLRASENLKHIIHAKKVLRKNMADSL